MATGQLVTAVLMCDNNGNWVYTGANGQSRVITGRIYSPLNLYSVIYTQLSEVNCVTTG
jgi:hypothetical protein